MRSDPYHLSLRLRGELKQRELVWQAAPKECPRCLLAGLPLLFSDEFISTFSGAQIWNVGQFSGTRKYCVLYVLSCKY